MNILAPISSIMTKDLITANPEDRLVDIKKKFDENDIHHIPVVRYKKLIGIISHTDLLFFLRGFSQNMEDQLVDEARLHVFQAKDIMTQGIAKVEPNEPIRTALEVFKVNRFHALPIVEGEDIVGLVTTHDIIKALADEPISLDDYKK